MRALVALGLAAACGMAFADERTAALARFAAHDDAAVPALAALVHQHPDDVELLTLLGRAELRSGATADAVEHLRAAAQKAPQDAARRIKLSEALAKRIDEVSMFSKLALAREVRTVLEQAVQLAPRSLEAHESLMQYELQAPSIAGGDRDKAEAELAVVRTLDAGHGYAAQALFLVADKKDAEAIAAYRKAIELAPDDADARFDLGQLLQTLERYDEAFDVFEALAAHAPQETRALYQVGKTAVLGKRRLERGAAALKAYLAAGPTADDDPKPAKALWRLGMVYELMQRPEDARTQYVAALKIEPGFKDAQDSLEHLH
jgi:tetratricopeptide (TPR) repeat protein